MTVNRRGILHQLVPVPGMLKVAILSSPGSHFHPLETSTSEGCCSAIFKGLWYDSRNAAAVPSHSQPSLPITPPLPKIHHPGRLPSRNNKRMTTKSKSVQQKHLLKVFLAWKDA